MATVASFTEPGNIDCPRSKDFPFASKLDWLRESWRDVRPGAVIAGRIVLGWQFRRGCYGCGVNPFHVLVECPECGLIAVTAVGQVDHPCRCQSSEELAERNKARKKHGLKGTRIYMILHGMKQRCHNPNAPDYGRYGAKGISVCNEWRRNPVAFVEWAVANGYDDSLTIDRKRATGNYEPDNCQWITKSENSGKDNREMSLESAKAIRERYAELAAMEQLGGAINTLSAEFAVSRQTVQKILDGKIYLSAGGPIRTTYHRKLGMSQRTAYSWSRRR